MAGLCLKHFRWSLDDTKAAEHALLRHLFTKDDNLHAQVEPKATTVNYKVFDVELPNGTQISTLRIGHDTPAFSRDEPGVVAAAAPLLLLHGFAAGKATWFPLFRHLQTLHPRRTIYLIDLPGAGCSTPITKKERKHYKQTSAASTASTKDNTDPTDTASHVISYYTSAIENWRVAMGVEQLVVIGHSFGALIALHYAKSFQSSIKKVILLAPVGLQDGKALTDAETEDRPTGLHDSVLGYIWAKYHITPLPIARLSGLYMPWLVKPFVSASDVFKAAHGDEELVDLLWKYVYGTVRHKTSIEAFMPLLISGKGLALSDQETMLRETLESGVEVTVIRGSHDWVAPLQIRPSSRLQKGWKSVEIKGASHSMHLDEPDKIWPHIEVELNI